MVYQAGEESGGFGHRERSGSEVAWIFALRLLGIILTAGFASAAADQRCQICHPREAQQHAGSAHANSLQPVLQSAFYRFLPHQPIGEARGGYLLTYEQSGQTLRVTAKRDNKMGSASIEWVFGAGRQAQTPVLFEGSTYREHRLSYYVANGRFDLTMGHARGISASPEQALGRAESPEEARRCFGCHSTGGMPQQSSFEPGVQCERCHAGALAHARGAGPVSNPRRLSAPDLVRLCAECHRDQAEANPEDPINVRYQAVRLRLSKCFLAGNLSCITCHDPHSDARRDAAWYRGRCLACHADQQDRGDCLECHMPRVSPAPHLEFTDHFIRLRAATRK
jgi:Cytochrome c554 and c-prime